MIKGMLACVRFHSLGNVVYGNALVHVLEGELACTIWPSQYKEIYHVLDFLHSAMLLLAMHLCLCHKEV